MPQALVSDQLNQDVMRGFLSGFQHAATLIQSRQQQEQENQRQQAQLDAQAKQHEETIRNQWAIEAMKIGKAADDFKRSSTEKRNEKVNEHLYSTRLNVIQDRRRAAETFLASNRDKITPAYAKKVEKYIGDTNKSELALGQVPYGADGMLDTKKLDDVVKEPFMLPSPEYKPEVAKKQALDIEKEELGITNTKSIIAKRESGGAAGAARDEKARAKAAAAFSKYGDDFRSVNNAAHQASVAVVKGKSNMADAYSALDKDTEYQKLNTEATKKLAPFVHKLADPNYVNSDEFPDLNQIVVSAMRNKEFDYLQSRDGYNKFTRHLENAVKSSDDEGERENARQLLGIATGSISPTPRAAALSEYYDQIPQDTQQQEGGE